jgi:2'-5' RNA ligase
MQLKVVVTAGGADGEESEEDSGVYAQLGVDPKDSKILSNLIWYSIKDLDLDPKKFVKPKDYHTTLLYSRDGNAEDLKPLPKLSYTAEIKNLELWTEHEVALVATLSCPALVKRHEYLMGANPKLKWDYPEYKPHITICYDLKLDAKSMKNLKDVLIGQTLILSGEKMEPLDTEHKDAG